VLGGLEETGEPGESEEPTDGTLEPEECGEGDEGSVTRVSGVVLALLPWTTCRVWELLAI
jgi:hypothetical protein